MKFSLGVGNEEKHNVDFSFNQFWGNLSIQVDGKKVIKDLRTISFSLTKVYEFEIGNEERHKVKIVKLRKLIFAGFRKSNYKVFIDGILINEYEGR